MMVIYGYETFWEEGIVAKFTGTLPDFSVEDLWKSTKNLSDCSLCLRRDSYRSLLEYKSEDLRLEPTCSVTPWSRGFLEKLITA
jgi:hypothetical protein